MDMTDTRLLDAAKRETAVNDAFAQILSRYEKLIWHIARRYFPNDEDAKDAFQETAIKIYTGLPNVTLPENGSLKSWICAVTANACLDSLRKRKMILEPLAEERGTYTAQQHDTHHTAEPSAEDEALARLRGAEILRAVNQLPHDHRILIILRDMNGLSYQELAEATGVHINTVKSRLSRARDALRKLLENEN